jgi:hypothetical protein
MLDELEASRASRKRSIQPGLLVSEASGERVVPPQRLALSFAGHFGSFQAISLPVTGQTLHDSIRVITDSIRR